ncbi:MAG: tetratricopeptide repeat protein [Planctomycetota bacterium]
MRSSSPLWNYKKPKRIDINIKMSDEAARTPLPPGREADAYDRAIAGGIVFLLIVAACAFAPAVPFPLALQRHAASLAGCAVLLTIGFFASMGRGFPIPPLPAATLTLAGGFCFSVFLCSFFEFGHSVGKATTAAAAAGGLVIISGAARSVARAHLGNVLFAAICTLGSFISVIGLAEAAGFDPLQTDGYYNSQEHPVATFGNPDAVADFIAPIASIAAAIACARGGWLRIAALACSVLASAYVGIIGVLYGYAALGLGLFITALLTILRVRRGGAPMANIYKPVFISIALPAIACAAAFFVSPVRNAPVSEMIQSNPAAPSQSLQSEGHWNIPPTLEVRLRIWASCINVIRSFAPWGTLGGNFSVGFAPFRDPREIQISTHSVPFKGRTDDAESIVNVAHNDPVQLVTELGVVGLIILGLFCMGLWRWRKQQFFSATPNTVAASAGLAALFVAACFHSPFYEHAAAAALGFVCLGIIGAADASQPERLWGRAGKSAGLALIICIPYITVLAGSAFYCDILMTAERMHPLGGAERLQLAANLDRDDERIPLALARRFLVEGNKSGAIQAYGEALRRHPYLMEALLQTGVLLAQAGDLSGASIAFANCMRLDPENPILAFNRAVLARDAKDDVAAAAILQDSEKFGVDQRQLRDWGFLFYENKQYARAVPYLDRWVAKNPTDADAYSKLGETFLKIGNRAAAELDLSKAHRLYTLEHLSLGRLDAAEKSNRQYKRLTSEFDAGPDFLEASIFLVKGDADKSAEILAKALAAGRYIDKSFSELPELKILVSNERLIKIAREMIR